MNLPPKNFLPLIPHPLISNETYSDIDDKLDDLKSSAKSGLAIAILIILVWAISLGFLLNAADVAQMIWGWKLLAVLVQTFLYTGLFITAHDAMHGSVSPNHPQINNWVGSFALLLYGLFSYQKLLKAHWQHHHHPASELDPDFHNGKWKGAVTWYLYFMVRYWSWWRLFGLITTFYILSRLFHISESNLIWFWIIPSLLSSIQLFYFGTFLPHREPKAGYTDSFRTQSIYRPLWWSFLTCYHFGYHYEHHRFPDLAWWQLPKVI